MFECVGIEECFRLVTQHTHCIFDKSRARHLGVTSLSYVEIRIEQQDGVDDGIDNVCAIRGEMGELKGRFLVV